MSFKCDKCQAEVPGDSEADRPVACPACGAPFQLPDREFKEGDIVKGFEIKAFIGQGGGGRVYLARQLSMDRDIAIKILPSELARDKVEVENFLNEVRMLARLEHENIVTAYESGEDDGTYFLAMAYIAGDSLDDRIDALGPMQEKDALKIVRQVASALSYVWNEQRMLHRDIKPANIILDVKGVPKLTDFGLCQSLWDVSSVNNAGLVAGTPNYMSPEQAQGKTDLVDMDCQGDIYSLGMTLYFMLTGVIPYEEEDYHVTIQRQIDEPLTPVQELNPNVTAACASFLKKATAKGKEERYATWDDFKEDIDALIAGKPKSPSKARGQSKVKVSVKAKGQPKKKVLSAAKPASTPKTQAELEKIQAKKAKLQGQMARTSKSSHRSPLGAILGVFFFVILAVGTMLYISNSEKKRERQKILSARLAEQRRLDGLVTTVQEAIKYSRANRKDYAGSCLKLKAAKEVAAELQDWVTKADAEIAVIGERRRANIEAEKTKLERTAWVFFNSGRDEDARKLLSEYDGEFGAETKEIRDSVLVSMAQKRAAIDQAASAKEKGKKSAVKAKYRALAKDVGAKLLGMDIDGALVALVAAEADPSYLLVVSNVRELRRVCAQLPGMQGKILRSFSIDKGKDITIDLMRGKFKTRIDVIGLDYIGVSNQGIQTGGATGRTKKKIMYEHLSVKEKLKRLGAPTSAQVGVMRGLLLFQDKQYDKAQEVFQGSGCKLGDILGVLARDGRS